MRAEGKRLRTAHLELRVAASLLSFPRVGLVVGKHGRTGVARNRLKRVLRELLRTRVLPTMPVADAVLRAHPTAYAATPAVLADEVAQLARKLGAPAPA